MWYELTAQTLLSRVAGPEAARLDSAALASGQSDVLDEIAGQVAGEWRGGLRRVTLCDSRAGYVPDELTVHILADFRYRAYTRLPGMGELLDEQRIAEWRRANQVRDALHKVSISPPDDDYAEDSDQSGRAGPAMADPEANRYLEEY